MNPRSTAAFLGAALLILAGCDNAQQPAQKAAQEPSAPTVVPSPGAPPPQASAAPAPVPAPPAEQDRLAKPPGADPAKLAEHARALAELGYKAEAEKLYGHACNWGYAPGCTALKALAEGAAQKPVAQAPAAAQPAPVKAVPTKPAAASIAQAPTAKPQPAAIPPAPAQPAPPPATLPAPPAAPAAAALPSPAPTPPSPVAVAMAKPAPTPAPVSAPERIAPADTRKLSQQAQGLEAMGYVPMALKLYKDACLAGDGLSCKHLGEIYIKGSEGVDRDYAESVRWYDRARHLGVVVPALEKRTLYR